LGAVVEIVSGMSLETYFNKNIFEPMCMKDTYFNVPSTKADRMPTVYTEKQQSIIVDCPQKVRHLMGAFLC
jgi:CubicO group peptidase (beta-lactamase class C family)